MKNTCRIKKAVWCLNPALSAQVLPSARLQVSARSKLKSEDTVMPVVNAEVVAGVVRHVLTVLGGALMMSWGIDGGTWEVVAGAIATLAGFSWSLWAKRAV